MEHRMKTDRKFPDFHSMASFDRMNHRMKTNRMQIRIKPLPSSHFFISINTPQNHTLSPLFKLSVFLLKSTQTHQEQHIVARIKKKNIQTPHKFFQISSFITPTRSMPPRSNRRQGTRRQRGDISQQHGVPFPVFNEEEVEIFKSLETRHVTMPKWFDLNLHEHDARLNRRFGSVITGYIDGLSAGVLARNKSPGFKAIMLEFITTFKIGVTGNMTYRLNGGEFELKENEVTRLLGIDGHGRVGEYDEGYDLGNFWNYLTGGRPGNFARLQASRIHDDEVYVAYKFIAHVILNKDESSVISKAELYALWCMMNGKPVRLVPLITSSLEYIIKSRTKQSPAYLAFGGLITMIAHFHDIDLDDDDAEYPSEEFEVTGRKVGNEWRVIPQNREEELPDSGNEDDEQEDEDAFDDGARPRRRVANAPAYMEVDERELEEDDEDDADYEEEEEADYEEEEEADYEEPNGWRAAETRMNQRYDAWSNENRVFQEEARSRHEEFIRRDDEAKNRHAEYIRRDDDARIRQEVYLRSHKELMDALARWNAGGQRGPPPS
ncbi:hypothetical protein CASFOL_016622 [Castilleja foliolosa]|uniref:Uncharacterized protein n=1 Tax=Castilleja foliolosa TaxID=1961234 RepID=A0ABD3D8Q8_9LAMI